jgi:molybdopterin molybdotransferase
MVAMLSIEDLQEILRRETPPPVETDVPIEEGIGHALAREIRADRDMPPFDRAMMDGYAVLSSDLKSPATLRLVDEIHAGHSGSRPIRSGECARIMTGAPVPEGADAVIQHEETEADGDRISIKAPVAAALNIAARGEETRAGDVVLKAGTRLRAPEIGIAAAMGCPRISVYRKPTVAVFATGDELVPPEETPNPVQIRNSNAYSICAQVIAAGFKAENAGIGRDSVDSLRPKMASALERHRVLIISGGVSAGERDLVIEALTREGVSQIAHKVAIKPGKPLFFGKKGDRRVFGLPGNPLSGLVTFEFFVRPFLGRMCGLDLQRPTFRARLTSGIRKSTDRTRVLPARLHGDRVEPVIPTSSGDLNCVTEADAFVIVPARTTPSEGEEVEGFRYDP